MAYKYSVGKRDFGDIEYEDDVDTQIDFEDDFVALKTAGNQVLVVSGSDVGIGISTPTQNLHVFGSGNTTLRIQGSDGYYGALNVKGGTGDSAWVWQPADTSDLRFFTVDDDRMVILGTGEIGVGTTSPATALDIHHNPTSLADDTGGGEAVYFGSGTVTGGKLYYLHTDGVWTATDADAPATGGDQLLGIALGSGDANTVGILVDGYFDAASHLSNFSAGKAVYISITPGAMSTTAPTGTGDIVRVAGYCTDTANVIKFKPSTEWIELA